eukprot:7516263-Alexandrium_andersonii.AAC.1
MIDVECRARACARHASTPTAPRYCAPPRRSACPPHSSTLLASTIGSPSRRAAWLLVWTTLASEGGTPRLFGHTGVAA